MEPVDLATVLSSFHETWSPRLVAELNGQHVRVAHLEGAFCWHQHEREDELFLVLSGALDLELRDRVVQLAPGQLFVVPRGVEHRPVAQPRASVLLFEPASTLNTGDQRNAFTVEHPKDAR